MTKFKTLESNAILELKRMQECRDVEHAHATADDILCDLLITLGYKDVINEYKKVRKWYG